MQTAGTATVELDVATSPAFIAATIVAIDASSDHTVVVDCAAVTFMDSSGLNAIVAYARSRNGAGPLVMLNPSDHIERLFVITGLDQHPKIEIRRTASARPHLAGVV